MAQPEPLPPAAQNATVRVRRYTYNNHCSCTGNRLDRAAFRAAWISQNHCHDFESFLSYKTWQPIVVEEYVTCSLNVFPDEHCGGEVVSSVHLPTSEHDAVCQDATIAYDEAGPEGSKSVRFECSYFPPPAYRAAKGQPLNDTTKRPSNGVYKRSGGVANLEAE